MTSGNPLLLRQLLRSLEDEGIPPDVSHVDTVRAVGSRAVSALVTLRLRRMPGAVTAVARAAALLGDAAGLPTVAGLGPHGGGAHTTGEFIELDSIPRKTEVMAVTLAALADPVLRATLGAGAPA